MNDPDPISDHPCPWCGSINLEPDDSPGGKSQIVCRSCGSRGPEAKTDQLAENEWKQQRRP